MCPSTLRQTDGSQTDGSQTDGSDKDRQVVARWSESLVVCVPAVLVPGLDLGVTELQGGSQLHAVLDTQVLLLLEASLQPRQLLVAERRPSFTRFLQTSRCRVRGPALHWDMTWHQTCQLIGQIPQSWSVKVLKSVSCSQGPTVSPVIDMKKVNVIID